MGHATPYLSHQGTTVMKSAFKIAMLLLTGLAVVDLPARGAEGVHGQVLRPRKADAKVMGCEVSQPGEYNVSTGDLIELEYGYLVVPDAIPQKVGTQVTSQGAVVPSPLGTRLAFTPGLVGAVTIVSFLEARKAGEETVTLIIDNAAYQYKIRVSGEPTVSGREPAASAVDLISTYQFAPIPLHWTTQQGFPVHWIELHAKLTAGYLGSGEIMFHGACAVLTDFGDRQTCAMQHVASPVKIVGIYEADPLDLGRVLYRLNGSPVEEELYLVGPPGGEISPTTFPYRLVVKRAGKVVTVLTLEPPIVAKSSSGLDKATPAGNPPRRVRS
jgi:hypothetical protein